LRVLHVIDDAASGVQSALHDWILQIPEADHHILTGSSDPTNTGESFSKFATVHAFPDGHRRRSRSVQRTVDEHSPDVVHAHSSWAGFHVRTLRHLNGARVVYSPHCFAFERRDIGAARRRAFWLVEASLAVRTTAFVVVSEREARLVRRFPTRARAFQVPVQSAHPVRDPPPHRSIVRDRSRLRLVAVGRLGPQKDPAFLSRVADYCNHASIPVSITWVGDGDASMRLMLESAGITVSGWLPREKVRELMAGADALIHTAAWEGSPVVIEEALDLGKPVIARTLPVFEDRGIAFLGRSPRDLADHARQLLMQPHLYAAAVDASLRLAVERQSIDAHQTLTRAYGIH
jgi:glycosyltransferase involved in cell wall biosynthesis